MPGIVGKLWEIVGRLWGSRLWERPCQLPLTREIVGRLKNNEIICGKGRPGREILFFCLFFGGLGLPRRSFLLLQSCLRHLRRAAEISIYIYIHTAPDRLPRPSPAARQPVHTNIYIYVYINTDVLNMRLHLVEIYQNTERSKTFKNTTCSTYHRTCPTYSVRSISRIS